MPERPKPAQSAAPAEADPAGGEGGATQARRSGRGRVVRAMFLPSLGLSVAPMRESAGAFAEVVAAAWAWASAPRAPRRRRRRLGVARWLLVAFALGCVAYGAGVLLGGIALAVVPEARAQGVDPGVLGGSDAKTRELLGFLYGIAQGDGFGLGEMLRYFSAAVLVVVGVVVLYQTLFAVVETGRTGEGRLTGWQVMRMVIGVALIFPLPATGLGPGQHIFLGLIDVGGNVAAGVWSRVATLIVGGGSTGPVRVPESHKDVVGKMLLIHTCVYLHNEVAAAAGHGAYMEVRRQVTDEVVRYWYRDPRAPDRYRPCGRIVVSRAPGVENPGALMLADAHYEAVANGRMQDALREAARELGDRFLPNKPTSGLVLPEADGWLAAKGLAGLYESVVQTQVGRAAEAARAALDEALQASIEREGWLAAASFFSVISRNQAEFHDALSAVPEVSLGGNTRVSRFNETVDAWVEAAPIIEQWLARSAEVGPSGRVTTARGDTWSSLFDMLDVFSFDWAVRVDEARPLESIVGMGHTMLNTGLVTLVGGGVGSVLGAPARIAGTVTGRVASWFGKAPESVAGAVTGAVEGAFGLVKLVAWVLVIGGVVLAYVVPLIPFLRFLFGVLSWVISVVEGLVAIPLFLALQVGGESRGLVTRASRGGYLLVLHAVVRPALLVFGLVFGYFIFVAAVGLFNWLFAAHLEGITNATTMGAITMVVGLVVYTMVTFAIANASFKAIEVIPAEVMRWLGGQARGGSEGGGMGGLITRTVLRGKSPGRALPGGR